MGKSMKLGGGGRFAKLEGQLAGKPGIKDPAAVAASIGRKKYGAAKMGEMAAKGKERAEKKEGPSASLSAMKRAQGDL
ncbi:hypothetical protein KGP36_02315 [Patescibacteria group bacterium]|nr:hypothetical protein [Patescibacteria group bacterium]